MGFSKSKASILSETLKGRVVVCDTSSLLIAGVYLIESLKDCRIVLPAVVIKELEEKRSHATLGFLAREWLRFIEQHRNAEGDGLRSGVLISDRDNVSLQIEPNHSSQKSLPKNLRDGSADSTILAVAVNLLAEGENVALLSNDMPMRLHASLELGIDAFEYSSVDSNSDALVSRFELDLTDEQADNALLHSSSSIVHEEMKRLVKKNAPKNVASTFFAEVLVEGQPIEQAILSSNSVMVNVGRKNKTFGITGKTMEQNVFIELLKKSAKELPVVSVGGGAGTGKTLLTIAAALDALKSGQYERIMVFRSLHELGQGQEMGFLPGGVDEKMAPWAGAIYDAIDTISRSRKPVRRNSTFADAEKQKAEAEKLRGMIEIAPITYLRGRSLSNTFMILEEAQNFSRSEILNILSRTGENTKVVLTFDANQTDNRFLRSGKNADVWSVVNDLSSTDIFAHITLTRTERSRTAEIASKILESGIEQK